MRGATPAKLRPYRTFLISIHTPHAGSDETHLTKANIAFYFNPHSPCGERQFYIVEIDTTGRFQSTLPLRGATCLFFSLPISFKISIHTPHSGSDAGTSSYFKKCWKFQSTLPMRGATCLGCGLV